MQLQVSIYTLYSNLVLLKQTASRPKFSSDMVKISMDTFVKRFQPDKYDDWINGTDMGPHPEDPTAVVAPAPVPTNQDIRANKK